jgi:hypothetical protein
LAELPGDWEVNLEFTAGLCASPVRTPTESIPQHAAGSRNGSQGNDNDFEDIDDVLDDVVNATIGETDVGVPAGRRVDSPITIDDDNDYGFVEYAMEQAPQTPLVYRSRANSGRLRGMDPGPLQHETIIYLFSSLLSDLTQKLKQFRPPKGALHGYH